MDKRTGAGVERRSWLRFERVVAHLATNYEVQRSTAVWRRRELSDLTAITEWFGLFHQPAMSFARTTNVDMYYSRCNDTKAGGGIYE